MLPAPPPPQAFGVDLRECLWVCGGAKLSCPVWAKAASVGSAGLLLWSALLTRPAADACWDQHSESAHFRAGHSLVLLFS